MDLQLGPRSEALQPGDLHAQPAADRCAGGRRRDLSVGAEGRGGDAAKATPDQAGRRRRAARLPQGGDAVRGREGGARQDGRRRQKQIELGRRAINRYGCFSCHDIKGFEKAQSIGTDLSEEGSKLVTRLDFAFITDIPHTSKLAWFRTKLHDPRIFDKGRVLLPLDKLRMPNFDFSDEEVDRLVTAIMSFQREIQPPAAMPARSARVRLPDAAAARSCTAATASAATSSKATAATSSKLVADPSLGPPMLTPEGARVQPDWLYAFLRGPITIRPWLNVRMPTFGLDDPNLNGVIRYFGAVSNTIGPFQTHDVVRDVERRRGRQAAVRAAEVPAVPRARRDSEGSADVEPRAGSADGARAAAAGLDSGWLKNPADILPGTRMPAFWPDYPKSFYPQLGGDAEAQIKAIRDYLLTFRGGPSPKTQHAERESARTRWWAGGGR